MPSNMADAPKTPVNPKTVAIMGAVAALFALAVAYYPPLLPVCQALNFCKTPVAVDELPQ